jgi:hypothetical protein
MCERTYHIAMQCRVLIETILDTQTALLGSFMSLSVICEQEVVVVRTCAEE